MTTATLEDVLVAANARIVALAPETSGYLVLAVADASSRLPFAIDDRSILLGSDGTLSVSRRGAAAAPPDAARMLRECLRRLLAASAGSMPGLVAAAKARAEVGVDEVATSIEGALIPLNRKAAQRAIARLTRQIVQLKESGHLPEPRHEPPRERIVENSLERPPPVTSIASTPQVAPTPQVEPELAPESEPAEVVVELSSATPTEIRPREVTPTILGVGRVGVKADEPRDVLFDEPIEASFTDEDASATVLDTICAVAPVDALVSPDPSQALTVVPSGVEEAPPAPGRAQNVVAKTAPAAPLPATVKVAARAELPPAIQSDVDKMLTSFCVAESRDPLRVAESLKKLAGLELTAAPPVVWESPHPVVAKRAAASAPLIESKADGCANLLEAAPAKAPGRPPRRTWLGVFTALFAIGAVGIGVLSAAHPGLLGTLFAALP